MASCRDCKNCIHYSLCNYEEICHYDIDNIKNAKDCSFFKDRPRFVELPYSLSEGDKLKYIFTDENNEIRIGDDWEVVTKICKDGFFVTGRLNSDGTYQAGDCFYPWSAIGTEYFLTKEEAEQFLKEREANANDLPQSDNHS